MIPYSNIFLKVRAIVAGYVESEPESLNDGFRWTDHVSEEDGGWMLAELQDNFGGYEFFKPNLTERDVEEIATVGRLIAYVEQKLAQESKKQ